MTSEETAIEIVNNLSQYGKKSRNQLKFDVKANNVTFNKAIEVLLKEKFLREESDPEHKQKIIFKLNNNVVEFVKKFEDTLRSDEKHYNKMEEFLNEASKFLEVYKKSTPKNKEKVLKIIKKSLMGRDEINAITHFVQYQTQINFMICCHVTTRTLDRKYERLFNRGNKMLEDYYDILEEIDMKLCHWASYLVVKKISKPL